MIVKRIVGLLPIRMNLLDELVPKNEVHLSPSELDAVERILDREVTSSSVEDPNKDWTVAEKFVTDDHPMIEPRPGPGSLCWSQSTEGGYYTVNFLLDRSAGSLRWWWEEL